MKKLFSLLMVALCSIQLSNAQKIYGDLNQDGVVNIGDVTFLCNMILDQETSEEDMSAIASLTARIDSIERKLNIVYPYPNISDINVFLDVKVLEHPQGTEDWDYRYLYQYCTISYTGIDDNSILEKNIICGLDQNFSKEWDDRYLEWSTTYYFKAYIKGNFGIVWSDVIEIHTNDY